MRNDKTNVQRKAISLIEIFLIISLTITATYFIEKSSNNQVLLEKSGENIGVGGLISGLMFLFGKIVFGEKGIVSAESTLSTCLINKENSICQEYPSDECDAQCNSTCVPSKRDSISQCKLGTCFDPLEGTCATQSPKQACENNKGSWFSDPNANIKECQRGCCILGDNALFVTSQQCTRQSNLTGIPKQFKPEINNELSCYLMGKVQTYGACVFQSESERTCRFISQPDCAKLNGEFHEGILCSNPDLKTNCQAEKTAGCVQGKDEIYWFDSCGNQENIYQGSSPLQKDGSFNQGRLLSKNESCSLGTSSNQFANRATCGNCDYLLGSRCGLKTATEQLNDKTINVVCRDLTCIDESGKVRQNGESWCQYDSAIGTEVGSGGLLRSVDSPGSEHFRKLCKDGDIVTEPCSTYRGQICVESKTSLDNGKSYSNAACAANAWQNCFQYNQNQDKAQVAEDCSKNSECFMKEINIADKFQFSLCSPKYPPGFVFDQDNFGKTFCNYASQKCTVVYVKQLSGWECKVNCDCESAKFTEQMNDLCISMGDCGAKVNYNGDLTLNYKVSGAPELSQNYLNGLKKYSNPIPGKVAEPGNFSGSIPGFLDSTDPTQDGGKGLDMMNMAFGVGGMVLTTLGSKVTGMVLSQASVAFAKTFFQTGNYAMAAAAAKAVSPALQGLATALKFAGAIVAVAAILYQIYGFASQGDYAMAAVVAVVAVASYIVLTASWGFAMTAGAALPIVGIIVMVVVLILQFAFGLGKSKQVIVEFKCKPWQPPLGGQKCEDCGKKGLPCTKYSCSALGQTCSFINEGTGYESCVNIGTNDATPPAISPLNGALSEGYSYQEVSDSGFKIKSNGNDGCFSTYTPVTFGINVNKYSYCKVDSNHTGSFEEMKEDFGDYYYLKTHNLTISMPSLESLGLPGYDPTIKADYNLYVRCQDKNGNKNSREYDINFCVKPGIDLTPPIVTHRLPEYSFAAYGATKINASVYTNEPSDCKYDSNDVGYDLMANDMNCANDLLQQELYGWRCDAQFDVPENDSVYYVNCKDQPWLVPSPDGISPAKIIVDKGQYENGTRIIEEIDVPANRTRNSMTTNYQYQIKLSKNPLKIDYIKPNSTTSIISGVEPVSVNVEVGTSGGADGNAECKYKSGEQYIDFFDTFSNVHKQTFQTMTAGEKQMDVRCRDMAGNFAETSTTFNVDIDTNSPQITRAYVSGASLNIVTDENAECAYQSFISRHPDGCSFEFGNGSLMSGDGQIHVASFDQNMIYYIKCKDNYGNYAGDCNMVVKGVDLLAKGGGIIA